MSADMNTEASLGSPTAHETGGAREVIYRHTFIVRATHWINALAIFILIGSGLNIFNAHPKLYWGKSGFELTPSLLSIGSVSTPQGTRGMTVIGPFHLDTTGVLGWSKVQDQWVSRAWPNWITIPSVQDLADARHWHFLFAWILVANGLLYVVCSLLIRHIQRDLWPTAAELKSLPASLADHIRLKHPKGEAAKRYNVLQKLAYLCFIVLAALMVLTGLTMSPGIDAVAPGLLDVFGGRQSARTLHFLCASLIAAFILVHLVEVVLAGPLNEVRSMITGRYRVPQEH